MVDPNETTAGTGASGTSGSFGVGTVVGEGRYRLTGRLGRGGMAEVFAAEDVRLGRIVAVKLLRGDLAEDPVSKARFTREAQAVAGLNHHAVVAVYDSGEDRTPDGSVVPYIVMELVEGHTIKELLGGPTPPPVDQALLIISGVLDALAYSHQHGIVHRDIKPANVIITMTGAVKVMDFGIARALHGAASTMTQTGMVMGTPQYLSPEQALGKSVDHRSDLYATGCLLYELLALRPPFTGETPLSVVYQHVQDEAQPPSLAADRVPPELDGMVLRALAKQPDDRFQSAEEMRGVVGYAHQALTQQGGWTGGMWNTGEVAAVAPPRNGTGTAPTVVAQGGPGGRTGSTAELGLPLLTGLSGAGADDGGQGYGERPPGGGNRWLKPVLFAIAVVLAIALGVYLATKGNGGGGGADPGTTTTPPVSQTSGQQTEQPTDEPTDDGQVTTDPTQEETSTAPRSEPTSTPPTKDTTPPTTPPTTAPTTPETTPPTTAPTTPETTAPTSPPATTPPTGDTGGDNPPKGN
jgi:tRNA A-37 threonylcarbamoyl transferase component Bud32